MLACFCAKPKCVITFIDLYLVVSLLRVCKMFHPSSDDECDNEMMQPDQHVFPDVASATSAVVEEMNPKYAFVEEKSENWIVEVDVECPQTGFIQSEKCTINTFRTRMKVTFSFIVYIIY